MKNLWSWETAKGKVHDTSGIDNPEKWLYEIKMGVYYPSKLVKEKEVDEMYEKLDPDMSDEEMESLGYVIKLSKVMGEGVVEYGEGCVI